MTLPFGYFGGGSTVPYFPSHSNHIPKIVWDGNTLEFGMPMIEIERYSEGDQENEGVDVQEGFKDGWRAGFHQYLAGVVLGIPPADGTSSYNVPVTGWDGPEGWRSFIVWAMPQRLFDFYPDRSAVGLYSCYLVEPYGTKPDRSSGFTRRQRLVLATADQSQFLGY